MEAISNTLDLIRAKGTPVFVVMNAVAPQGQEAQEAAEAIAELDGPIGRFVSRFTLRENI